MQKYITSRQRGYSWPFAPPFPPKSATVVHEVITEITGTVNNFEAYGK